MNVAAMQNHLEMEVDLLRYWHNDSRNLYYFLMQRDPGNNSDPLHIKDVKHKNRVYADALKNQILSYIAIKFNRHHNSGVSLDRSLELLESHAQEEKLNIDPVIDYFRETIQDVRDAAERRLNYAIEKINNRKMSSINLARTVGEVPQDAFSMFLQKRRKRKSKNSRRRSR